MRTLIKNESVDVCGDEVRGALHARFVRRKQQQGAMDAEEARDLFAAMRVRVWEFAGCASFVEYLERYCGLNPHAAYDRVRVASALQELPLVEAELEAGELTYSHVRELVRIVVPETEQAWIDHTRGMTVKQVTTELSGHKKGDLPDDEKDPDEHLRTFSLKLRPSTIARLNGLIRALESQRGDEFVDDDDKAQLICDALETGGITKDEASTEATDAPTVSVWLTPEGDAYAYGALLAADERETALCCGDDMGHVNDPKARTRRTTMKRKKKRIKARDGHKCVVPGCRNRRYLDVHHIIPLEKHGKNKDDNLCTMCSSHHRLLHRDLIRIIGRPPDLQIERVTPRERRARTTCTRSSVAPWAS